MSMQVCQLGSGINLWNKSPIVSTYHAFEEQFQSMWTGFLYEEQKLEDVFKECTSVDVPSIGSH